MSGSYPRDYESLRVLIAAKHDQLSKRLKQIAEFALDHPTDMALETIAVIAKRADVPPSALIRFSKAFGYPGFSRMQRAFQSRVVERSASYKERVRQVELAESSAGMSVAQSLLEKFCRANIVSLEDLQTSTIHRDIEAAGRVLVAADRIYVVAQRRSFPIASYLSYALNQADHQAILLDGVGGMLNEHAKSMRTGDALVAVTFPPYSPETAHVVSLAVKRNVPIIAITDSQLSPIAAAARVLIQVHDAEVHSFRSMTASFCIAQTLATALAFGVNAEPGA